MTSNLTFKLDLKFKISQAKFLALVHLCKFIKTSLRIRFDS